MEIDHASQASSTNFTPTSSLPPLPPLKIDRLLNTRPEMTPTTARNEIDHERISRSSTPAKSARSPILGRQLSLPIGCSITLPGSSLTQQPTASCIRQVSECLSSGTPSPSTSPQEEDDPRRLIAALLQSPPSTRYRRLLQNNASMLSTPAVSSSSSVAASSPTSPAAPSTTVRSRPPSPPPRISSVHHSPQLFPATTEPGVRGGRSRGYSSGYTGSEFTTSVHGPFPVWSSPVMSHPARTIITDENAIYCNIVNGRCSPIPAVPPSTLSMATTSTCIAPKRRDSTSSTVSDAPSCSSRSSRTADIRRPSALRSSSSAVVEQHHSAIIVDRSPSTSRPTAPAPTSTIVPDDWSSPSALSAVLNRRSLSLTHQQTANLHGDESRSMFDSIRLKLRSYWSKGGSQRSSRSMKSSADLEGLIDYRQSLQAATGNSSRSTLSANHHGGGRNLLRKSPSPSSSSVHSFMDRSIGLSAAGRRDLNGSCKVSDDDRDDDDDVTISPEHEFRKVTSDDGSDLSIGNSPIATRNSRTSGSFKSFTGYL